MELVTFSKIVVLSGLIDWLYFNFQVYSIGHAKTVNWPNHTVFPGKSIQIPKAYIEYGPWRGLTNGRYNSKIQSSESDLTYMRLIPSTKRTHLWGFMKTFHIV